MKNEDLKLIEKGVRKNRRLQLLVSSILIIIGMFWLFFDFTPYVEFTPVLFRFIGVMFLLPGIYFLLQSLNIIKGDEDEFIETLRHKPDEVVWVYYYIAHNRPWGISVTRFTTLYLKKIDNTQLSLSISKKKAEQIMNLLRSRLPHATFGYSHEKAVMYQTNPGMLRKE